MKRANKRLLLSIVTPFYNEAAGVKFFLRELEKTALKNLANLYDLELILVDDGSRDETAQLLKQHKTKFQKQVIELSRNFGHQAALLAGLTQAQGDLIITMDGDLQHPPSFLPNLLAAYDRGNDVVLTYQHNTSRLSLFKQLTANFFYWLINLFSFVPVYHHSSDFRLLSRGALDALLQLPEKKIFLRGMVSWIGFPLTVIPYDVGDRVAGGSKYTLGKMVSLALSGFSSFSTAPLYLSAAAGVGLIALAGLYSLYVLYVTLVLQQGVAGWSSVILVILVVGSVLSLLLAIIGMYIAAIYDEVKQRPIYLVKKITK